MVRGRKLSLLADAAAAGRLDFSKADSNSPKWQTREALVLQAIERERKTALVAYKHIQHAAAAASWPTGDTEGILYKRHCEKADELFFMLAGLAMPWKRWDYKSSMRSQAESLRADFVKLIGEPGSPEVKAIAAEVQTKLRMEKLTAAKKVELEKIEVSERQTKLDELRRRRKEGNRGRNKHVARKATGSDR